MNKIIYKWLNDDLGLELNYKKYFNIESLQNEKLKELIVSNSEKINKEDIELQLKNYIKQNYEFLNLSLPCEVDGEQYKNGYEMLSETDEIYYRLSSLLDEFDEKYLTLELNETARDYYKFMYDNFEVISELLGE